MIRRISSWVFLLGVIVAVSSHAQEEGTQVTAVQDPQAVMVLTQALNASGVTNPLKPIQNFVATGTITYFWAGEEVKGSATVRGRSPGQFRLDASLPDGTRTWVLSHGAGALMDFSGNISPIPLHNTLNLGVVTYPCLSLGAVLSDSMTTVLYVGAVNLNGRMAHHVRVQRGFQAEGVADNTLANLRTTDYFVDAQNYLLLKTLDMTHPPETFTEDIPHEMYFENYLPVDGVFVPFLVGERIIGQTTWELRLATVTFNVGLSDMDFTLP